MDTHMSALYLHISFSADPSLPDGLFGSSWVEYESLLLKPTRTFKHSFQGFELSARYVLDNYEKFAIDWM